MKTPTLGLTTDKTQFTIKSPQKMDQPRQNKNPNWPTGNAGRVQINKRNPRIDSDSMESNKFKLIPLGVHG